MKLLPALILRKSALLYPFIGPLHVRHLFGFFFLEVVPLETDSFFLLLDEVDPCSSTLATEMKLTVFQSLGRIVAMAKQSP